MRPQNVCLLPAPNWELSCYVVAKQEVQNPPDIVNYHYNGDNVSLKVTFLLA